MQSMRSWLSLIMISQGSMSASRSGTRSACRSMPTSPLAAISLDEEVMPAAPRSCSATSRSARSSSRQASSSFFSVKGSPTCTDGRFSSRVSSNTWLASTLAPPMPSRPVLRPEEHHVVAHAGSAAADDRRPGPPGRRSWRSPGSCRRRDLRSRPRRPPWGCPCSCRSRRCPPPPARTGSAAGWWSPPREASSSRRAAGAAAGRARKRAGSGSISPNRRESSPQMGRAPMAKMSRMMPPTPVAAPW